MQKPISSKKQLFIKKKVREIVENYSMDGLVFHDDRGQLISYLLVGGNSSGREFRRNWYKLTGIGSNVNYGVDVKIEYDIEKHGTDLILKLKVPPTPEQCPVIEDEIPTPLAPQEIERRKQEIREVVLHSDTYLSFDGEGTDWVAYATRENGSVYDEVYSTEDYNEAVRVGNLVQDKLQYSKVFIETTDEWVSLLINV